MRFSAGKALSDSFAIMTSRFAPLAAIAAIFSLVPMALFMFFFVQQLPSLIAQQGGEPSFAAAMTALSAMAGTLVAVYLAYIVVSTIGQCAMCVAAGAHRAPSVGEAIAQGVKSLLPMLGVVLLLVVGWIALLGIFFLVAGGSMFAAFSSGAQPDGMTVMGFVGMFLVLMVAVVYVGIRLVLVLPVVTLGQQRNPLEAIANSWRITKGASLKIFLLFTLFVFVAAIINSVVSAVTGGLGAGGAVVGGAAIWTQIAASAVMSALFGIYTVALLVAIYKQLAGTSTDEVSDTFA